MGHTYYYLVASLSMLEFGMKMPFLYSDFLTLCQEQLSSCDMEIINRVRISPYEDTEDSSPTLREWKIFDTALRNEIAKRRAVKRSKNHTKYIRGESYSSPFISEFVRQITNQDSPLEAEISLDSLKWEKIEELKIGHYFDIDYLITYALQLQILERWEKINSEGGMQVLQGLLEQVIE